MNAFWGTATYSDGTRVVLRAERCQSKPKGLPGTHACRSHREHVDMHRCICGKRWNSAGVVAR